MKKSPQKSILRTLFFPYTLLFIIAFFIIMGYFVITESEKIQKNSIISIENNVRNISEKIDNSIKNLDTVSQNIIYSNLIKEHFATYLDYQTDLSGLSPQTPNWDSTKNNKILHDLLTAMIGPNAPVDQVNLYSLTQGVFCNGLDNNAKYDTVKDKTWYPSVMDLSGQKYVFLDLNPSLGIYFSYPDGEYFLSLGRLYYNVFNIPQGIVEVKKSFVEIMDIINAIHYTYQEEVYLYDSNGTLIYPLNHDIKSPDYCNILEDTNIPVIETASSSYKYAKETHQYLLYNQSSYSGFTTVLVVDRTNLLNPIFQYLSTALLILLLVCASTVLLSYIIAKRICTPLNKMYLQVRGFELSNDIQKAVELEEIDTSVTELNTLYQAFLKMQKKARISMENELLLQSREIQSRILALQVQMNPHFLYNSLSTIQAMADEEMNEEIIMMCQNISKILRYISADTGQMVTLSDEISHTKNYMNCMQIRYLDRLSYTIAIPDEMLTYQIPKLCLQLLVENAIKYTTSLKGPWHIQISGITTSTHWEIQIKDNGPGFSKAKLEEINHKISVINETGFLPNLEINGMGLMNIYIRFKLLYKGNHIFRLSNQVPTGAIVTIGAKIL